MTHSEINHPLEEQANPQVHDPPQHQPQEELLPSVPVAAPKFPVETQLTTMMRSG